MQERRSYPKSVPVHDGDPAVRLRNLEADISRVAGVSSARVVGDDVPREIHVVATVERPPKQVVRDVQSLAAARFGISIDHRIVSVVQMDKDEPLPEIVEEEDDSGRLVIDRVVLASKGRSGWVRVGLRWPDGEVTEGAGVAGATRESRARGASLAVQQALEPVMTTNDVSLDVDQVLINQLGVADSVTVKLMWHEGRRSTALVGSALIDDDVASATVRAFLQAINRKIH
ncbi:MAG: hypothetical protein ACRDJV_10475 [Actinomycetota bacterium]